MITTFFVQARVCARVETGPLGSHLDTLIATLQTQGWLNLHKGTLSGALDNVPNPEFNKIRSTVGDNLVPYGGYSRVTVKFALEVKLRVAQVIQPLPSELDACGQ